MSKRKQNVKSSGRGVYVTEKTLIKVDLKHAPEAHKPTPVSKSRSPSRPARKR